MPFYVFDGINGRLMTATLRPGKTPTAPEILAIMKRLVKAIRKRFPTTIITFRADSHHTKPAVMDYFEKENIEFITGLATNKALVKLFGEDIAQAKTRYECRKSYDEDTKEVITYTDAYYAAGTWSGKQRVIARIIAGPQGVDVRYVVTSFKVAAAKYLYTTVYCGRGEAELFIKECKLGLGSDTSPCQKATANQFRLITFRADSHHTKPAVMDYFEKENIEFITGLATNKALVKLFGEDIAQAKTRYECRKSYDEDTKEVITYTDAYYAAGTWSGKQRVIARIIAGPQGVDVRYVVTSFKVAAAKYLYTTVYCGRGEAELFIKECKLGLGSDTSPCQKATANQFRLFLHAAAYAMLHRFRSIVLKGTPWEDKTCAEIRLRLFKIAGRIEVMKTKVRLHLSVALEATHRIIWERCAELGQQ